MGTTLLPRVKRDQEVAAAVLSSQGRMLVAVGDIFCYFLRWIKLFLRPILINVLMIFLFSPCFVDLPSNYCLFALLLYISVLWSSSLRNEEGI